MFKMEKETNHHFICFLDLITLRIVNKFIDMV